MKRFVLAIKENVIKWIETEDFKWIIWKTDGDTLTLIADGVTSVGGVDGQLRLNGATGYNNCVKILNDLCNHYYSNASLGAEARSMNQEDIEVVLNLEVFKPTDSERTTKWLSEPHYAYDGKYVTDSDNRYYPYIWQFENYAKITNSDEVIENSATSGFGQSEQPNNELILNTANSINFGYPYCMDMVITYI